MAELRALSRVFRLVPCIRIAKKWGAPMRPTSAGPGPVRRLRIAAAGLLQTGLTTESCTDTGGGQDVASAANGTAPSTRSALQFHARHPVLGQNAGGAAHERQRAGRSAAGLPRKRSCRQSRDRRPRGPAHRRTFPAGVIALTGTHNVYLTLTSRQLADFVNVNRFAFGR